MLYLIGDRLSKRTKFFLEAAQMSGIPVRTTNWDEISENPICGDMEGAAVKIDPPSYKIVALEEMYDSLVKYKDILGKMELWDCHFLNTPGAILNVLDKRKAKKILSLNKIPVTEMVSGEAESAEEIFSIMEENRVYSVFIKPVDYSGAAGVAALRINPYNNRIKMYTSCRLSGGMLYNTKKIYVSEDWEEITCVLEKLVQLGIIIERWHPKDTINGKSYDLRVVYQSGKMEYIVVRQSGGPVTNLHLNNQACDIKETGLSLNELSAIEELCSRAVSVFDGLNVAGLDILISKESRKPRVIEINGQGDLIYQDIFSENKIYKRQIELLSRWG